MDLKKERMIQNISLRSIQSQSFPFARSQLSRFTGAPTSEDINGAIITINEQIKQQSTLLDELKEDLDGFKKYLAKAESKKISKPMTN